MTATAKAGDVTNRRLRLGMVGGGPGAFIGSVHRLAARVDDHFELVAAALTSDPTRSRAAAVGLHIAPERAYGGFVGMAGGGGEAAGRDGRGCVGTANPVPL